MTMTMTRMMTGGSKVLCSENVLQMETDYINLQFGLVQFHKSKQGLSLHSKYLDDFFYFGF